MRPFPLLAAVLIAGLVASVAEAESWFNDVLLLVLMACLATTLVGLNWWELWSTRDE
jgi:hypothetical protein